MTKVQNFSGEIQRIFYRSGAADGVAVGSGMGAIKKGQLRATPGSAITRQQYIIIKTQHTI
jgi:hypothetical protein